MAINTDIQQQVFDLLSRASNLSFVSAEQEGGGRIALMPGQRITAEVLQVLPNNRTQVQIGSSRYNLELPIPVRAGQSLSMTFVAHEPRETFAFARPGVPSPPVSLSDASRLLALLAGSEQIADSTQRASLEGLGDMLRRSSGEAGVLANLMDEALTYSDLRVAGQGRETSSALQAGVLTAEQARLSRFEANAAQILQNIAQGSRFILTEAANAPLTPLPLMPGEEVEASVLGTLPGGRVFVQVAGTSLELQMARQVREGDILRLTFISSQPKPMFAVARPVTEMAAGALSEAGRWLSVLEHSQGGVSGQQLYVLERLNTVLKSLPPDSPAFTAIKDEAITYQTVMKGARQTAEQAGAAALTASTPALQQGSGIVMSDDMTKLLQALLKGNRLALLEAINQQAATGFAPGQQLKAEVLASLGGGRFLVQAGRLALEFSLPKGIQKGDLVNLFFISEEPAPTFLLARFGRSGDATVSETGKWLSGFIGATAGRMQAREAFGLLSVLLSGPPVSGADAAIRLQQGLRESGLFYESHLARWFGGEFTLEQLLSEPQGRLSALRQSAGALVGTAEGLLAGQHPRAASLALFEEAFAKAGRVPDSEGVVDRRVMPVVREQLETLQSGQVVYRGELFSGQPMKWTIGEREAGRNSQGEVKREWLTSLRLDLPGLGPVSVRLELAGGCVNIDISAADAATADRLAAEKQVLAEQLQAAGLEPAGIGVRHEPE
ncbi:MAG TPA: flagellar hook-length control protein FliK [Deltaproteobacteria bacterium]|nr:flagellar hook-length control protein FliK [Deltaproteobacteria bacterium]HQB38591.1 flagellar hook-length control protein FliK [Deltaproteobacteria bacterium]